MAKSTMGAIIAKYRKAAGMTQEELGKAVGVSTQAVSRWECGGTPDVELLPAIADKLKITVDALFGRDGAEAPDLGRLLYDAVTRLPEAQRLDKVCDYVWMMERAAFRSANTGGDTVEDMLSAVQCMDRSGSPHPGNVPWQFILDNNFGSMLCGMTRDMRFALVLPEPEKGFASMLKKPEEYLRLFRLLSKPHYLDMLIDIYTLDPAKSFTDRLAASRLGIPQEEARAILDELSVHYMVRQMDVADENGALRVYGVDRCSQLGIFLFFCGHIMNSAKETNLRVDVREKPWLNAVPGNGCLMPDWVTRDRAEDRERGFLSCSDPYNESF